MSLSGLRQPARRYTPEADSISLDSGATKPDPPVNKAQKDEEDEADDYMTMVLPDTSISSSKPIETSLQRRQRLKREAEARSRPKSKAETAAAETAQREEALATSLDKSNKGYKMMAKLGFKEGGALGRQGGDARTEPIGIDVRLGRGGIGLDEERKRKVREEVDESVKRTKANEGEYWERLKSERGEKEKEGKIWAAMHVCERLDEEDETDVGLAQTVNKDRDGTGEKPAENEPKGPKRKPRPLRSIPVLWRALARQRVEKEQDRRRRHDLMQSLSRLPTYDDPEEDNQDKQAFGVDEEEIEEEDPELEGFLALPSEERLEMLVNYLRETHHYCFWCKFKYPDQSMEGCPGPNEDDHD